MRFFSRRATSSRGRRRLLAPCDKSSKEGLGEPCRIHVRLAGCGLPLLRLYHALAGIMGVDREGGYAISFLTRVGGGITRVGGGITRVKGDRVCFLDSDLAIIPYSVRAESMTSLFTSELRSATLPPRGQGASAALGVQAHDGHFAPAGSEYQDGNCRSGSRSHTRRVCPELYAGDGLSWRRVTYAPGPSHKPSKIARFPRKPAPAPRVGRK